MSLMMDAPTPSQHSILAIILTLLLGFVLTILPVPDWLVDYRPAWVSLILIYWAIMTPEKVSVGVAFIVGLLLDAFLGTILGEYALLCMLVVFVAVQMHQRLRIFPLVQQCVFIFLLLGIQFIILVWIQGLSGQPVLGWHHGLSVLGSTLMWPVIYGLFRWMKL